MLTELKHSIWTRIVFVVVIFAMTSQVFSFPAAPHHAFEYISTQTPDGINLKGLRLANPEGKKILLLHGFAENTRIFRELAYLLHSQGWDVYMFNFRGHGNGEQKSLHHKISVHEKTGLYSFEYWASLDVPTMIDYVSPDPSEKIVVLGHSLGGAALRIFLSGLRARARGMGLHRTYRTQDQKKIQGYANKVEVLHAVGSPTGFSRPADFKFIFWSMLPEFLQKIGLRVFSMKKATHSEKNGLKTQELIQETIHRSIHTIGGYDGLVGSGFDIRSAEMARAFRKGFTYDIPLDLISDVNFWNVEGFKSSHGVSFQHMTVPANMRFVQTVAISDGLARADYVIEDTKEFRFHHTPEFVIMENHQHIDMVSGKSGATRIAAIIEEKSIGVKFSFSDMSRKTLNLPKRCSLYFSH